MNVKITTKAKILLVSFAILLGLSQAQIVKTSLYGFYSEQGLSLPSISERAELAAEVGIFNYRGTREQNILLEQRLREFQSVQNGEVLGFSVVSRYKSTLASSMTSSQTTVPVSSIVTFDGHTLTMADLGSSIYLTIEPGTAREEIVKCTSISSSQWATCTRGLAFYGTSEAGVAANQKAHNAGSVVVMSNVHYVYDNLVDKDSTESLEGIKTVSSTEFLFGQGVSTTLKFYFKNTNSTSTSAFLRFNNGQLGWSDDGVNTFTFAQGGSGLTASSTKAIGITDSKIHLNVSSTSPLTFSPDDGSLYIKDGSNSGIYQDANGIAVERYDSFDWYGNHTFNARTNVSSTFQSTQPLTVFSTTTSSTLPRVATDFISATSSGSNVTTTITNNLRVEGFVSSTQDFSRNLMATGQSSQAVNTTGNQVISHNLNFIPSLITIQAMARTDATSFGGSYGTATSDLVDSVTYWGSDGANDTAGQVSNVIVSLRDGAGNIEATANLTAVTSNSFTLDWTTNSADGSSRFIQWAVQR